MCARAANALGVNLWRCALEGVLLCALVAAPESSTPMRYTRTSVGSGSYHSVLSRYTSVRYNGVRSKE